MQTKYEQITELRETATLINQLEFKIQFNSNSIEQLTKYNSHKENTDLINELTAITDKLKAELKKGKIVFDLLLNNIKPYQVNNTERELQVGDVLVSNGQSWAYPIEGEELIVTEIFPSGEYYRVKKHKLDAMHMTICNIKNDIFYYKKFFSIKP